MEHCVGFVSYAQVTRQAVVSQRGEREREKRKKTKKKKTNIQKKRGDCVDCHCVSEKEASKKREGDEEKERPYHSRSSESPGFVGSLRHGSKLPYLHHVPVPVFLFGSCPPS